MFDKKQRALDEILEADEFSVFARRKQTWSREKVTQISHTCNFRHLIDPKSDLFSHGAWFNKIHQNFHHRLPPHGFNQKCKGSDNRDRQQYGFSECQSVLFSFRCQLSKFDSGGLHEPFFVCLSANAEWFECSSSKTGYLRVDWSL